MVRTKLLIYYTFIVRHAKRCNCMSTPMFQISVNSTAEEPSDTLSGIHAYMYSLNSCLAFRQTFCLLEQM